MTSGIRQTDAMARRVPEGPPPPPVVQRVRLRYAKRGRLRFTSHRDFARAFERALRRAAVPMAYSGGFTPHPKISYVGAVPTGVASEAEYLEIGLAERVDVHELSRAIDAALPGGLDIVDAVETAGSSLADRMEAASWRLELDGVDAKTLSVAVDAFLAEAEIGVERLTKDGRKIVDARGPVLAARVSGTGDRPGRAILDLVVRLEVPAVRPDDVLAALRTVAGLARGTSRWNCRAMRLAQGPLHGPGVIGDPFAADRVTRETTS
jgi:radical SAM-linked protein